MENFSLDGVALRKDITLVEKTLPLLVYLLRCSQVGHQAILYLGLECDDSDAFLQKSPQLQLTKDGGLEADEWRFVLSHHSWDRECP